MNILKFGAHIAHLRKELDMPQSTLADKVGVTRQAVSKWERGEGFPDITLLTSIAQALGADVAALIKAGEATESQASILSSVAGGGELDPKALGGGTVDDVIGIAPYLKASTLSVIAEQLAKHNIDISRVVELAEFMNDESVVRLLGSSDINALDDELLMKLIPFLDQTSVYEVFERVMDGRNGAGLLKVLSPFIAHDLFETAYMHGVVFPG